MIDLLIADDNQLLRKSLTSILESIKTATRIDYASDGLEAITKIKSKHYDLIILDLSMPKMKGSEIIRIMRKLGIDSKVLVFSLEPNEVLARNSISKSVHFYISKAATYSEIKNTLIKAIGSIIQNHD